MISIVVLKTASSPVPACLESSTRQRGTTKTCWKVPFQGRHTRIGWNPVFSSWVGGSRDSSANSLSGKGRFGWCPEECSHPTWLLCGTVPGTWGLGMALARKCFLIRSHKPVLPSVCNKTERALQQLPHMALLTPQ